MIMISNEISSDLKQKTRHKDFNFITSFKTFIWHLKRPHLYYDLLFIITEKIERHFNFYNQELSKNYLIDVKLFFGVKKEPYEQKRL